MIKIIDAMCGAGKSTYIIKMMKDNPDKKYLYVTPFLSEVEDRIPEALPELEFSSPLNKGGGKLEDLEFRLKRGDNIACTHVLYSMFTQGIVNLIIEMQYTLIIDEALSCVGLLDKTFVPSDIQALRDGEFIFTHKDKRNRISWNEVKYPNHDGRYSKVRSLCQLDMLYAHADEFIMYELPPKLLKELPEVYVLTYLFHGSDMRCWLELNDIDYHYVSNDILGLRTDSELKKIVKDNLVILENRTITNWQQRRETLSKNWFRKATQEDIAKIKRVLRSTVTNTDSKLGDVFWTCYKEHENKLSGKGYIKGLSPEGKSFLPCNIRATNDYRDHTLCMYCINMFKNSVLVGYLRMQNIEVDEDTFALSEMLQFIFRGSIRQGKEMKLLLVSKRMRTLLEEWLNN